MKILFAGDWHSNLHEEPAATALTELGHDVIKFKWFDYFKPSPNRSNGISILIKKIQNKFLFGPILQKINSNFLNIAIESQPDIIFIYRGTHIKPLTLQKIKNCIPHCILAGYNNDDPFSPAYSFYFWRYLKKSIPFYDIMFAYRHHNIPDYQTAGANRVGLLRSWFVPNYNYPTELTPDQQQKFETDVVFIGHYEPDGRIKYLEEMVRHGIKFKLFGPGKEWNAALKKSPKLRHLTPVQPVWGNNYNLALNGAKIALCFLSKLNRDTYTRRCFEIPATGTMLLSEYSDDLTSLFKPGIEADFFKTPEECVKKIDFYLRNQDIISHIAKAGFDRVYKDQHDVKSRMRDMVENCFKK